MKMAEYIDREALKNDIAKSTEPFNTGSVFRAINCQIAADVAPVVHGRWKAYGAVLLECQNCGEIYSMLGGNAGKSWNYCPNCGVKMDGGSDALD